MKRIFTQILLSLLVLSCKKEKNTSIIIKTNEVTEITTTSAISGGVIEDDGGKEIWSKGVCWSQNHNPTISDSKIEANDNSSSFVLELTNLKASSTYYVRAFLKYDNEIVYGQEVSFKTVSFFQLGAGVTDIEGNNYSTIILDNKEWFAENLKVSKFSNGDVIPQVTDNTIWSTQTQGSDAWCYYDNDLSNNDEYGKLYNWYVASDSRNVCPTGWHVSTNYEFDELEAFFGSINEAGRNIKKVGFSNGTGLSGLDAIPNGYRETNGAFINKELETWWWTSTTDGTRGWCRSLSYLTDAFQFDLKFQKTGMAIRCVKD